MGESGTIMAVLVKTVNHLSKALYEPDTVQEFSISFYLHFQVEENWRK